jgi:hypothetical protein
VHPFHLFILRRAVVIKTPARQSSPPHRQRAAIYASVHLPMMICALLISILCAVPRVGAALRFDGHGDSEIDDFDADRPRMLPLRQQTKSGQPVTRTDEPSFKRRGFCVSLAKGR